MNNSQTMAKRW